MAAETTDPSRFTALLIVIVLASTIFRVGYVVAVTKDDHHVYDATYYELQARDIVQGKGFFRDPFEARHTPPQSQPAADHPPLTVIAILPAALIPDRLPASLAMRFTMVAFGTVTLVLIALLGRILAGPTVGLVAAAVAALDPNLWMNDGLVMSESLATMLTMILLFGVYRVLSGRSGGWRWPVALGVVTALVSLTRAELGLYLPLLVLPALYLANRDRAHRDRRAWLRPAVLSVVAFGLVLAPWVTFNMARFQKPTTVSTTLGLAANAANCDFVYHGDQVGYAGVFPPCTPARNDQEQSVWDAELRKDASRYLAHHWTRLPVVAAARLGRVWNVFRVGQTINFASLEGRPKLGGWLAAISTWILVPFAVAGGVILHRRRQPVWPLLMPVVAITLVLLTISGGLPRYRAPAEPGLVLLAAVAIVALVRSTLGGAAAEGVGQGVAPGDDGLG